MATAKIIELDDTNTCKICDNALAKYSCPKCNILYCSLTCYQSECHLECSESFYQDNVMQELDLDKEGEESRVRMLEILKRMHENNKLPLEEDSPSEDEDEDDLTKFSQFVDVEDLDEDLDSDDDDDYREIGERLAGVNLDDAEKVWERLTQDERQDFVAFLKSEDVTKFVLAWEPWWTYCNDNKIEEVNEDFEEEFKKNCPDIVDIKDLSSITTKPPADCVKYNLVNILAAYAFTVRYFNGEHNLFCNEAVACITNISLTLKNAENFDEFYLAVKSVEQECINIDWIQTDSENILLMCGDLDKILKGPKVSLKNFYALCALSDMQRLMNSAIEATDEENNASGFSKKFPNDHFPSIQKESADKIKSHLKKIEYYLAYAKDCFSL